MCITASYRGKSTRCISHHVPDSFAHGYLQKRHPAKLSRDAIITLIALLFNLLCTFAGCEMESISHEDNIQSHRDAIQAHQDAVQAHEDAVQAHLDFSQSQSIENNKAALQTQISKNTSLDGANDDD